MMSVSPNRAERRKIQTRERLKQAAIELILAYGYPALTIKAITDQADLGYGTFYLYYTERDDIVWEVLHDNAEQWRSEVDKRLASIPTFQREYLSWIAVFRFASLYRDSFIAMMVKPGSAKILQNYQNYLAQLHETNIRAGFYSAHLDLPPAFQAQFMSGALVRLLIWWLETSQPYTPAEMATMLYQTIFRQPPPQDVPVNFWDNVF